VTTSADNPNAETQQRLAAAERHAEKTQTRFQQAKARLDALLGADYEVWAPAFHEFQHALAESREARLAYFAAQPFTAFTQCPEGHMGLHLLYPCPDGDTAKVFRVCVHDGCRMAWRQVR